MNLMPDLNNRPGGPHLIVTAKTANKVRFFDAATLAKTGEIDVPASTHEMVLSPDGKRAYLCCHDDAVVLDVASGSVSRTFPTESGCEFIIAYA
jgi:DNA-binding beta-propeller fold protein YncE